MRAASLHCVANLHFGASVQLFPGLTILHTSQVYGSSKRSGRNTASEIQHHTSVFLGHVENAKLTTGGVNCLTQMQITVCSSTKPSGSITSRAATRGPKPPVAANFFEKMDFPKFLQMHPKHAALGLDRHLGLKSILTVNSLLLMLCVFAAQPLTSSLTWPSAKADPRVSCAPCALPRLRRDPTFRLRRHIPASRTQPAYRPCTTPRSTSGSSRVRKSIREKPGGPQTRPSFGRCSSDRRRRSCLRLHHWTTIAKILASCERRHSPRSLRRALRDDRRRQHQSALGRAVHVSAAHALRSQ